MKYLVAYTVQHDNGFIIGSLIAEQREEPISERVIMNWTDAGRDAYANLGNPIVKVIAFSRMDKP